jgi:LPS export ABC transporter permease LptG/LPS export ABC transporter permease LptF
VDATRPADRPIRGLVYNPLVTLDRYIVREILPPFLLALVIFTFLLVLPPIMDYLENLLAKGVTWGTAARIIWTLVPQALGLTIPMALLVGILIGLGRLSGDREAVALLACGVSPYRLLRPILGLGLVAAGATLYVMMEAIPDANQTFREITFQAISKRVETEVRPRVFFEDFPGWVLYPRDEPEPGVAGWKELFVADNTHPDNPRVYFTERGRLVLDHDRRTVDLVLSNGTSYATSKSGEIDTSRFRELVLGLNPDAVFPQISLQRGAQEKRIPELRADAAVKIQNGVSPHPEIILIQQKFSIPVACLVFAVIGLALGLSVAREGKLAGFVVGILVIFAYYILMFLSESFTKGYYDNHPIVPGGLYLNAHLSRWWPNILMGLFGIGALIWRARYTQGVLPRGAAQAVRRVASLWSRERGEPDPSPAASQPALAATRRGPVVVVRIPRLRLPTPGILDRYISRAYLRVAGLAFLGLLGLFYISTFIDRSDKVFKGEATVRTVMTLLVYQTPQFVYFIIPIAALISALVTYGMLSRTSELTVLKACGVSLYRSALSVILLSLVFSGMLFGLEQRLLARANRQAEIVDAGIKRRNPRVFTATNRRWVTGREGDIYHYSVFDPDRRQLAGLTIYRPGPDWGLTTAIHTERAAFKGGRWEGINAGVVDYSASPPVRATFPTYALPSLESPDYFESEQPVAEMMTVGELRRYVDELSASGLNVTPLKVELQHKLAFPFVTLVMTLLAVPFGVTTGRRGALYGIGLAILIALSYWITMSIFVALGRGGLLVPWLAGWAPNIIVLGAALYLFLTVKT